MENSKSIILDLKIKIIFVTRTMLALTPIERIIMEGFPNRMRIFLQVFFTVFLMILFSFPGECANRNLDISDYVQTSRYYCGPTVLYLVLEYWGLMRVEFNTLVSISFSNDAKMTENSNMVFIPRLYGLKSYSFNGNIKFINELILRKIPVIVLHNYSKRYKAGHFRIVVGIDKKVKKLFLKDPSKRRIIKMDFTEFENLWARGTGINRNRWAMVVLPDFYGLPIDEIYDSSVTYLNLGTYYYKRKDYQKAYKEFKEVYNQKTKNIVVMQYYTQVLIRLKKYGEAAKVANEILKFDPSNAVAYDLLGLSNFFEKKYEIALFNFRKALKLNKSRKKNSFIYYHYQKALEVLTKGKDK